MTVLRQQNLPAPVIDCQAQRFNPRAALAGFALFAQDDSVAWATHSTTVPHFFDDLVKKHSHLRKQA
jgi:hypothetical protein